jgi:hypothetical protein
VSAGRHGLYSAVTGTVVGLNSPRIRQARRCEGTLSNPLLLRLVIVCFPSTPLIRRDLLLTPLPSSPPSVSLPRPRHSPRHSSPRQFPDRHPNSAVVILLASCLVDPARCGPKTTLRSAHSPRDTSRLSHDDLLHAALFTLLLTLPSLSSSVPLSRPSCPRCLSSPPLLAESPR